jgi:hypothetical protein
MKGSYNSKTLDFQSVIIIEIAGEAPCTRGAHRMLTACIAVNPMGIPCASGVHPLYTTRNAIGRPWHGGLAEPSGPPANAAVTAPVPQFKWWLVGFLSAQRRLTSDVRIPSLPLLKTEMRCSGLCVCRNGPVFRRRSPHPTCAPVGFPLATVTDCLDCEQKYNNFLLAPGTDSCWNWE